MRILIVVGSGANDEVEEDTNVGVNEYMEYMES